MDSKPTEKGMAEKSDVKPKSKSNAAKKSKNSKGKEGPVNNIGTDADIESTEEDFGGIEISEEQLEQIKLSWKILDEDEDGRITEEEILRGAQLIGLNPTAEDVRGWLSECDIDGDLSLDYYEYEKLMRQHYAVASFQQHELRKAFAHFDTDGKGFLNRKQLYKALRNCGDQLTDKECAEFFALADTNNDGKISLEEFVVVFTEI